MRVTSIQLEIKDRSKEATLEYVLFQLDQSRGSDLILLPEIWPTGYLSFDRYAKDSEPVDGPLVQAMRRKAAEIKAHLFMGSFVERDGDGLYNTSLFLNPKGEILAKYRKIHLFGFQSDERKLLCPGKEIVVTDTPWGKVGLSTCYDLRFPEFYRKMLDLGAKYFLVTSAWPYPRLEAWTLFNKARAHENLAYLFSCNCAGIDRGRQYVGHSMFVDPLGIPIASAGDNETLLSAEVDMGLVDLARKNFTALDDRVFK